MLVKLFAKTKISKIILLKVLFFFVLPCTSYLDSDYFKANATEISGSTQPDFDTFKGIEDELLESTQINGSDYDIFFLLEEQSVTIASKIEEKATNAPSIVTVITEEEIKNIGARKLTDILRIVPGFDIIQDAAFGQIDIGVRGIRFSNAKIRLLIDGHSVTQPFSDNVSEFFDDLSLKNVKRIEIIRGPGSALYGRNAFLAVINVITKEAADIDGIEVSSGFGSFDTQEYSIMYGKNFHGIDIAGFVNFYNTNGLSDTIKEDALSGVPFFNRFSIAPGDTDDSRNKLDLNLKLSYKDLELKAKYMNRDTEPFVGPSFILVDDSDQQFNYAMGELSYQYELGERLTLRPRVYYDQWDIGFFEDFVPDGITIPFDLDGDGDIERFPGGQTQFAKVTNRRWGSELQLDYDWFDNNRFTFGFNYEWERQTNANSSTNFDPLTGASFGTIQDVSDTANFIRETVRQIWAIYIQDKWDITDNLGLTIGIRHDHYSDFEGTTNPRIGLVWNFMEDAYLKLLYGQAFRAPAFVEQFTINNPVVLGNPDLKPETIRTYEIGLGYKFTEGFSANVNYFFNVIRDDINFVTRKSFSGPEVFDNLGGSNIQGIEFEVKADLSNIWEGAYAFANYTYQDAESKGDPLRDVPKHKGNVGFNVGITKYLSANVHAFISDERVRAEKDTRDDSPGYGLVNLTLIAKEFFKDLEIKASLYNLLDKDYNDPSIINTIPTDLPRPGRTFFLEFQYDF